MIYRLVSALIRVGIGIFFRRCEVVGRENIPRTGPLLLIANHVNGLVDPFLLLAVSPRRVRIVAKHTLWRVPVLRSFLEALGAIPVYRPREDAEARRRNAAFFETCVGTLRRGGAVAIFPEGTSHEAPAPLPLRTGAARIALEARAQGAAPAVVPIGLNYEQKDRFRSDLVVLVGPPLGLGDTDARVDEAAARELTDRFARALQEVVVGLSSWEEHRLLGLLVGLAGGRPTGACALRRRLAFARGYGALRDSRVEELRELREHLERIAVRCRELGIPPDRLEQRYAAGSVARWLLPRLDMLLLGWPLGVWGLVNNWLPYRATGLLAARLARNPDDLAMLKLIGALVVFPGFYVLQTAVVWAAFGAAVALPYALLLAPSGYYALRYWELEGGFRGEVRLFVRLLGRRREVEELRRERRAALERVDRLAATLADREPARSAG